MYNQAKVTYGDITLEADYIAFDFQNNEVLAFGKTDTAGQIVGSPIFSEGDQSFNCDTIRYNLDSNEGVISSVRTDDNESYVHAEKSKRHSNEQIHNLWGKYTTCNKEDPHYHFRFKKMIVIPAKEDKGSKIVTGPVFMKVRKVPLPLALPFGFFPNSNKQKAGIIIPSYGESGSLGFFLRRGGYYLPLGEHFDTQLTGNIYTRGSWGLRSATRYVNKYKYSGGLEINYDVRKIGDTELNTQSQTNTFNISWDHRQDAKASVNRTFTARVNIGSIQKDRNSLSTSTENFLSGNSNSTISYTKTFKKSQLSATFTHNQNVSSGEYTFNLPSLNFTLNRFFLPTSFLRKNKGGSKWYEKIAVNYNSRSENRLQNLTESELRIDDLSGLSTKFINGIIHNVGVTTSLKAGPLSINPSVSYRQRWHFKRNERFLNTDSLTYDNDTTAGFWMTDDMNMSANMTTKIFGMFQFKSDKIKAIRHVITPSVGFNYTPEANFDIGGIESDTLSFEEYNPYSFGLSAYSQSNRTKTGALTFGLMNNIEMKIRDRKDTTGVGYKKVGLIDNISLTSAYNLTADSVNLSNIKLGARTKIAKNLNVTYTSNYNPYLVDGNGRRINEFRWSNGALPILINNSLTLDFNFSGGSGKNRKKEKPSRTSDISVEQEVIENNRSSFVDFNVPWSFNAFYTLNTNNDFNTITGTYNKEISQNVRSRGDVRLLEKVKLAYNISYNLETRETNALSLDLHWDLHCWEFVASYIPNGIRQSYNIRLNVKSAILQDLKLQKRGDLLESGWLW